MIITYHGKQSLKLQQGDFVLAYNPIAKDSPLNFKTTRFGSDITLVSTRHPNYNGVENTQYGDADPLIVQGPGSYERAGVTINGFESRALINNDHYVNTVYFVTIDNVTYCFLGDLADPMIDQSIREFSDEVDVLVVPIGGEGTLSPSQAARVIKTFSPKVVIPVDYGKDRETGSLDDFMKEVGGHTEAIEKYVFKPSDLEKLTGQVVIITEQ